MSSTPRSYYTIILRWPQYEAPALLFVPTPLVLFYYKGLAKRDIADDRTHAWITMLTKYVFMAGEMVVINATDGAWPSYYTLNAWFYSISGGVLFWIYDRILDALKYFRFFKFSIHMCTNLVLTVITIHRCTGIDWKKLMIRDGLYLYELQTD